MAELQQQAQGPDPSEFVKNPEFLKLPIEARHDVLRTVYKEYADMPSQAQQQVLKSLPTAPDTDVEKAPSKNVLGTGLGSKIVRGASLGAAQGIGLPMTTDARDFSLLPGMSHLIRHPIDSAGLLGGSALDAMKDRFSKAQALDVATRGKGLGTRMAALPSYLAYGLEGAIPFVGPAVGQMSDLLEQGVRSKDPEQIAESVAQALTTGATLGLTKGTKATTSKMAPVTKAQELVGTKLSSTDVAKVPATGKIQPALANTPAEILQHAGREGIQLTPYQATKNPTAGMVQAVGERSMLGAKQFTDATEANAGKFNESVRKLQDRVDPKAMGLSPESAGESLQQSAQVAKDVSHTNASAGYQNLTWAKSVPIETSPLSQAWSSMRGKLPMGAEKTIMQVVPREMRAQVAEMLKPTGIKMSMNVEQGIALRSLFRELGDAAGGLPDRVQGVFQRMTKVADNVLDSATKKAGTNQEWRQANAGWKNYQGTYGDAQSPINKILNTKDSKQIINTVTSRRSAADIEMMRKEGMDGGLEAVKRQVIEDIAKNNFGVGKNGIGGYSDGFLKTLFGPDVTKELYLKGELARRFKWQMNPSGTSNVLMGAEQLQHPGFLGGKWMIPMGAAKASMPRNPLSFLPTPAKPAGLFNVAPGLMSAPILGQGTQPKGLLNQ